MCDIFIDENHSFVFVRSVFYEMSLYFSRRPQVITDKRCFHVVDRKIPSGNEIFGVIEMEFLVQF